MRNRGIYTAAAVAGFMLIVAGCQSGDGAAALETAEAPRPQVRESELRAFCPIVTLRQGTASFNTYAEGGQDDATKLVQQASLSDATRACSFDGGSMMINVVVAGRVVPGPLGKAGPVKLPIRVAVVQGEEVLYTKLHDFSVDVADTAAATQFTFADPAVTIAVPQGRNVAVFAGFDEGPYETP